MEFIKTLLDLISKKVNAVNTTELAIITAVYPELMRCDIKFKSMVGGNPFELKKVPISFPHFGGSTFIILPEIGDLVLISYTRRPLKDQITNRGLQTDINEGVLYDINNAIVISSLYTDSDAKPLVKTKELMIRHSSGSTLRIKPDGTIELVNHDAKTGIKIENGTLALCAASEIRIEAPQVSVYTHKMPIDFYKSNTSFEPVQDV